MQGDASLWSQEKALGLPRATCFKAMQMDFNYIFLLTELLFPKSFELLCILINSYASSRDSAYSCSFSRNCFGHSPLMDSPLLLLFSLPWLPFKGLITFHLP